MPDDRFEDDGRTVADMSGIERPSIFGLRRRIKEEKKAEMPSEPETPEANEEQKVQAAPMPEIKDVMSPKDRRAYVAGAMGAAMLIGGIFIAAAAIFIIVLLLVWK